MKRTKCGNKKGFTIIETSLVLAIAGLILVMAFIALPALQRQQRDTKRKDDAMHFMQALKNYQSNNRGNLPNSGSLNGTNFVYGDGQIDDEYWDYNVFSESLPWGNFYVDYLGDNFVSPSGKKYYFRVVGCAANVGSSICEKGTYGYGSTGQTSAFQNSRLDWIMYAPATCEGGKPTLSNNPRNVAMVVMLESGGDYCVNN